MGAGAGLGVLVLLPVPGPLPVRVPVPTPMPVPLPAPVLAFVRVFVSGPLLELEQKKVVALVHILVLASRVVVHS